MCCFLLSTSPKEVATVTYLVVGTPKNWEIQNQAVFMTRRMF